MDDSTIAELSDQPRRSLARRATQLGMLLIFLIALLGGLGLFGPRTASTSASAGDYDLEVTYASITRAGQPAPLHVRVTRKDGFTDTIQVSLCDGYFDGLDFQSWYPTPSAETGTDSMLVYEFDPPEGDTLEVSLDARTSPGQLGGTTQCEISVLEQDEPVVSVSFRTWRMP